MTIQNLILWDLTDDQETGLKRNAKVVVTTRTPSTKEQKADIKAKGLFGDKKAKIRGKKKGK